MYLHISRLFPILSCALVLMICKENGFSKFFHEALDLPTHCRHLAVKYIWGILAHKQKWPFFTKHDWFNCSKYFIITLYTKYNYI